MAELHLHGGRAVVGGALVGRWRDPKDFVRPRRGGSRRAFDEGRMDLTQVEGLADLVIAETEAQRRQAFRQADGALRDLYEGWRERLVRARAWLEAELLTFPMRRTFRDRWPSVPGGMSGCFRPRSAGTLRTGTGENG